jgi:hypothetical protein
VEIVIHRASDRFSAMILLGAIALLLPLAHAVSGRAGGGLGAAPDRGLRQLSLGRCGRAVRGAHVVRANRIAIVYSRDPYRAPSESDLDIYACLRGSGAHWHLDGNGVDSLLGGFLLQDRYFAWTNQTLAGPASEPQLGGIELVDLLRRRTLVIAPVIGTGPGVYPNRPYAGAVSLPSVAIGPHGELAWMGSADAWYPPGASRPIPHFEVWASYHHKNTKLDGGPDIARHSLRLSADGTVVTWQRAGQTKRAPVS